MEVDEAEEPRYNVMEKPSLAITEIVNEEDKKNVKAPKTAGGVRVFEAAGRVERILLGNCTKDDEVAGVANIHGCLAQVVALCEPKSALEQKLFDFFGVDKFGTLASSVRNKARHLFCIMDSEAKLIMEKGGNAATFYEKMELLGSKIEAMSGGSIEAQLNARLTPILDLKEDLFNPGDIFDPSGGTKLLLALVAAELIKVEWRCKFDEMGAMPFTTTAGAKIQGSFCGDAMRSGRRLPYLVGGNIFRAVGIACKPKEDSERSMILVLPNEGHTIDEAFTELARMYNAKTVHWRPGALVDLLFPKMDVEMGMKGGKDIIPWIAPSVSEIFDAGSKPFAYSFPSEVMQAHDLEDAFVMKVVHCAAFKADHMGAEAKAVTVATVGATYRSMSAAEPEVPIPFHCDKPFGVLLVNGPAAGDFSTEFVAKIAEKGVVRA